MNYEYGSRGHSPVMDIASPSPEKDNFLRIAALLIDGGTKLFRSILDSIHTPASLSSALAVPKTKKKLKKANITKDEWDKLYPRAEWKGVKSGDMDILLLGKVLRYVCNLPTPPAGWSRLPDAADESPSADVVRILNYRREIYAHAAELKLDTAEFEWLWHDISAAMIRLAKQISTAEETKWKGLVERFRIGPVTCEEQKYSNDSMKSAQFEREPSVEEETRAKSKGLSMSSDEKLVSGWQGMNTLTIELE